MALTDDDMAAVLYAYDFALRRLGELVALDVAAEMLRTRHQGLDKASAETEVLRLLRSNRSLSGRTACATAPA
ncbi:MAG TPA: hypothetical protein VD995_01375 [Azospirillum sp.]|nr:hypothetical protein [Azospirillum sp.]